MFQLLEMSMNEISEQVVQEERAKAKQKHKAELKQLKKHQGKNSQSLFKQEQSEHSSDDRVQSVEMVDEEVEKVDFSEGAASAEDGDDESSMEEHGESIWANAADIFNPAKRHKFVNPAPIIKTEKESKKKEEEKPVINEDSDHEEAKLVKEPLEELKELLNKEPEKKPEIEDSDYIKEWKSIPRSRRDRLTKKQIERINRPDLATEVIGITEVKKVKAKSKFVIEDASKKQNEDVQDILLKSAQQRSTAH